MEILSIQSRAATRLTSDYQVATCYDFLPAIVAIQNLLSLTTASPKIFGAWCESSIVSDLPKQGIAARDVANIHGEAREFYRRVWE